MLANFNLSNVWQNWIKRQHFRCEFNVLSLTGSEWKQIVLYRISLPYDITCDISFRFLSPSPLATAAQLSHDGLSLRRQRWCCHGHKMQCDFVGRKRTVIIRDAIVHQFTMELIELNIYQSVAIFRQLRTCRTHTRTHTCAVFFHSVVLSSNFIDP